MGEGALQFRVTAALAVAIVLRFGVVEDALAQSNSSSSPEVDTQSNAQPTADQEYRKKVQALHWVAGPKDLPALGDATLSLPGNYIFLDNEDTKKFMVLNQNPPDAVDEQLFAPKDLHWFATIDFSADGYLKDDEPIDA